MGVIGGLREIRDLRRATRGPRHQSRARAATAVAEYTGLWGWDVVPGTPPRRHARATPLDPALTIPGGTTSDRAVAAWTRAQAHTPGATVILPTGRRFDVIDVPQAAGRRAVLRCERMALPLGPVAVAPHGRAWFLVAPGAAAELPALLYRMGWDGALLDLRGLGPGGHITAPPSDHGGLGCVRWLRPPDLATAATPPQARLLLGTLAYACHRATH